MITAVNEFLDDLRGGRMVESPVVRVAEGQLQGKLVNTPSGKSFYSFQGIPYAKPPIGSLRFKAPEAPEPWVGIRDATTEGNCSAQIDNIFKKEYLGDENCLFLNVYTPNLDGEFLPVMVYIHGGGYHFGSGSTYLYGADYLVEKDVVVVTINYRLGALGFLCLNTPEVPGNAGLKDMAQALRWVKDNIGNFGGNSGNLTVFGESAGGAAVSLLTASPLSKSLINKAAIQSGTGLNSWAFQHHPLDNAKYLASELGCETSDVNEILEYLTTTPVRDIVEALDRMKPFEVLVSTGKTIFGPVVEKEFPGVEAFLSEGFINILTSGRVANIPIMIGSTTYENIYDNNVDDFQAYIPEELHIEKNTEESLAIAEEIKQLYFKGTPNSVDIEEKLHLLSDLLVNIDTHRYIQYLVNVTNKPIFHYKFDYVGELNFSNDLVKSLGLKKHAVHMDELGYIFKNEVMKGVEPTADDIKTRERMVRLWTNFAKSGNPTPDENHYIKVTWLPVTKDTQYYLNIGNELSVGKSFDKEKMEFWDKLYSKYFKIWDHQRTNETVAASTGSVTVINTSPIIVEETIITTVTTVVNEKGEEKSNTQVLVDVQDNAGHHYQETFTDLKGSVEESLAQVQENLVQNDKFAVQDNIVQEELLITTGNNMVDDHPEKLVNIVKLQEKFQNPQNGVEDAKINGNFDKKPRPSNEIKMVGPSAVNPKDVIRANDPPEDDLPKNIGVNKFVNFFESLGGKK